MKICIANILFLSFVICTNAKIVIENFEGKPQLKVFEGSKRGGKFILAKAPDARGISAMASWGNKHFPYQSYQFKDPIALSEFSKKHTNALLEVWVYGDENRKAVKRVAVRLIDSEGEIFQYKSSNTGLIKPGRQKLTYRINQHNAECSFGKKANKKIDLPLRLQGFALTLNPAFSGEGNVFFDDINYVRIRKNSWKIKKLHWNFDRSEKWQASGLQNGDSFKLQKGKYKLKMTSKAESAYLFCRKDRLVKAAHINKLILKVKNSSGVQKLYIGLKNKKGVKIKLKPMACPRQGLVLWKLPEDLETKIHRSGPYSLDFIKVIRRKILFHWKYNSIRLI